MITIPIVLTYILFSFVINALDRWMAPLISTVIIKLNLPLPENFYLPGLGMIIVIFFIFLMGLLGTNYFGNKLVQVGEALLKKTPFVRGIYNTIKQVIETISKTKSNSFKELVLVKYPHQSLSMIGLVAGTTEGEVATKAEDELVNVFLPLLPNVTLGFYVVIPKKDVTPLKMGLEEGMKYLMSFGIVDKDQASAK